MMARFKQAAGSFSPCLRFGGHDLFPTFQLPARTTHTRTLLSGVLSKVLALFDPSEPQMENSRALQLKRLGNSVSKREVYQGI
jgi:hypothetical protein